MTLPPEAQAHLDALRREMPAPSGRTIEVKVHAYRHGDGKWRVTVDVEGKKFAHTMQENVDTLAV